ncbi:hypothetical protein NM208_g8740 [Fusarium decemcellulare]|uniref:Uncharacterized protein n=1 Tax=Fusarium decemcellulare TaxID=57161 RepID=A0ACC1S4C8_9HYPO|nr:hypothetical protein NM208_g8740 [Fusarium decemcellulare]
MDPASIIGTTSAVLTFVDTAVKIFSIARQVHDSAAGGLEEHERLRDSTSALEHGITTLEQKLESKPSLSAEEANLLKVATHCRDVGKKISDLLAGYQIEADVATAQKSPSLVKKGTGRSFRKATKITLRVLWDHPEAKELKQEFNMCTVQLNAHLTLITRSNILEKLDNLFARCRQERSTDFEEIRNILETTLVDVSEKSNGLIKQIDSMELKLDQAVDNHSVWLERINKLQKLFKTSDSTIAEINCRRILKAIAFQDIKVRHNQVAYVELAENTFEWMVKDETVPSSQKRLKQSFRNWLEHGEGIFHISGKPGSGKSTLMNFLIAHPETRSLLNNWACNGNTVIIASMFLWNIGSVEQKGMDGMLRTLLYNILNQHKELIPQLFGNIWNQSSREPWIPQQHIELTRKEMKDALQKLISDRTRGYQYCLFIDGADEFEDENMPRQGLAAELTRWASHQGVKICVSSREEAPWTSHFSHYPKLELHLTTEKDIRKMIEKYLSDDRHLKTFDPTDSGEFVSEFVRMARGVFIWVKLVLRELEAELDYEASLDALYQVLKDVPEKLGEFYERILLKIPSSDTREAWAILDVLVGTAGWDRECTFTIYHYSLLGDLMANSDFYQQASDYIPLSDSMMAQAQDRVCKFRKRLPLLFRGMVETKPTPYSGHPFGESLLFSHRSMFEYLRTRSFQEKPRPQVESHIMTLRCLLGQVNRLWTDDAYGQQHMFEVLTFLLPWIEYAFDDSMLPVLGLLDETLLRRQLEEYQDPLLDFFGNPDTHGDTTVIEDGPNSRVVSVFSVSCLVGFHKYLDWAINTRPSWMEDEGVRAAAVVSASKFGLDSPVRSAETVSILFGDGFSPNSWYTHPSWPCSLSPWIRFLFNFLEESFDCDPPDDLWSTVAVFLEHGADMGLVFSWTTADEPPDPDGEIYVAMDVEVKIGAGQDGRHSEKDTLSFNGKEVLVRNEVISRFPHGGSVREILLYFAPPEHSTFFNTFDRKCDPTETESQSQLREIAEEREGKRIGVCDLPVQSILICVVGILLSYLLGQLLGGI